MTIPIPYILAACFTYLVIGGLVARVCVLYGFPEDEVAMGMIVLLWPMVPVAAALLVILYAFGKIVAR